MTVVAWDGRYLAADRMCRRGETISEMTKIKRISTGEVLAVTGALDYAMCLIEWYELGSIRENWPEYQKSEDCASLIVASKECGIKVYDRVPIPIQEESKILAWGGGMDVAIGAMAMGACAEMSVVIASRYINSCGLGVDVFDLKD